MNAAPYDVLRYFRKLWQMDHDKLQAEIERRQEELAAIATAVLSANVAYPDGCNLGTPGKLVELVYYLASRAELNEPCIGDQPND